MKDYKLMSAHQVLDMVDAGAPRDPVNGMAALDPRYLPEYKGPTLLGYINTKASEKFKQYCRDCLIWHRETDSRVPRPRWLKDFALQCRR